MPTGYPYSQLARRTVSAFGSITAAAQVWGMTFIRMEDGYDLLTPAAVVDGTDNTLKVFRYESLSGSAPTEIIGQAVVPWTLEGSDVRLDVKRELFVTTVILTNMTTGQQAEIVLDYADGTGGAARAWGRPCLFFPATTEGGVLVSRFRMTAGYPFPAAKAAGVVLMGDSIAEGSQITPNNVEAWTYLIERERAANGSKDTVVAARGGQTSKGGAFAVDEVIRLCDANTVVILNYGVNDANTGVDPATWQENVEKIIAKLRTRTNRIALGTLVPTSSGSQERRAAINALILGNAIAGLLPPIRFDLALSVGNDGVTRDASLYHDSIHPNVAGNVVMAERVRLDCPMAFE